MGSAAAGLGERAPPPALSQGSPPRERRSAACEASESYFSEDALFADKALLCREKVINPVDACARATPQPPKLRAARQRTTARPTARRSWPSIMPSHVWITAALHDFKGEAFAMDLGARSGALDGKKLERRLCRRVVLSPQFGASTWTVTFIAKTSARTHLHPDYACYGEHGYPATASATSTRRRDATSPARRARWQTTETCGRRTATSDRGRRHDATRRRWPMAMPPRRRRAARPARLGNMVVE